MIEEWSRQPRALSHPLGLDGLSEGDLSGAGMPEGLPGKAFIKRTLRAVNAVTAQKRMKTQPALEAPPGIAQSASKEAALIAQLLGGKASAGQLALALQNEAFDVGKELEDLGQKDVPYHLQVDAKEELASSILPSFTIC